MNFYINFSVSLTQDILLILRDFFAEFCNTAVALLCIGIAWHSLSQSQKAYEQGNCEDFHCETFAEESIAYLINNYCQCSLSDSGHNQSLSPSSRMLGVLFRSIMIVIQRTQKNVHNKGQTLSLPPSHLTDL